MINSAQGVLSRNQTTISIATRIVDATILMASLAVAWWVNSASEGTLYWIYALTAITAFHIISQVTDLYVSWRGESIKREVGKILLVWILTFLVVMFFGNIVEGDNQANNSTPALVLWLFLAFLMLVISRVAIRILLRYLRTKGYNTRSVVIVGAGDLGRSLALQFIKNPWMGYVLKGFYDDKKSSGTTKVGEEAEIPVLGELAQLIEDTKRYGYEKIYIALPMRAEEKMRWLVDELSDTTASVYVVPDVFTFELLHAKNEFINGFPTISIYDSPVDGSNALVKRLEDIVLTIPILALIAIPMMLIAAAVKLTSKGPVIFKQLRYGIDGKPIKVYKFRTMKVMENGDRVVQAKKNDSRLTPIGGFLRRTSLDELPQFFNVLQGRMSIVGPRPHAVAHNEEYRKLVKRYMLRHKVKPGITGWAQVNGWRGETDTLDKMEKRVEYDLEYINKWSLALDLKIIFLTIFKGFFNKNAY